MAHYRIEDMASWYVDRMMTIQSSGPFFVGGMCAGGVIAYEICRQLKQRGEDVGLLLLLDAATPQAPKRFGRVARGRLGRLSSAFAGKKNDSAAKRLIARASLLRTKALNVLRWEASNYYGRRLISIKFAILRATLKGGWRWPSFIPQLTVREIYECCERTFSPTGCVQLPAALCIATEGKGADTPYREIYADNSLGWKTLIQGLEIVEVRGGHSSMLQEPFVESLAAHVCARLTPNNNRSGAVATEIQLKESA
jgi:thioesterase domain-containing protein